MSEIRWCDPGGHPFSINDPDREEYASTKPVANGEQRTRIDICGPCKEANAMNITTLGQTVERKSVNGKEKDASTN